MHCLSGSSLCLWVSMSHCFSGSLIVSLSLGLSLSLWISHCLCLSESLWISVSLDLSLSLWVSLGLSGSLTVSRISLSLWVSPCLSGSLTVSHCPWSLSPGRDSVWECGRPRGAGQRAERAGAGVCPRKRIDPVAARPSEKSRPR